MIRFLLCFVFAFWVASSHAQQAKLEITASKLKRIPSLNVIVAEGNAVVKYKDMRLEADYLRLNEKTRDLVAQGHVYLWERNSLLVCERLEFNLETKEGIAYKAHGFLPPYYYFSGEKIKKLSGEVYSIVHGTLTTCGDNCTEYPSSPDWSFYGGRVIIKREQFAKVYNLVGKIKRVPVFYSPFAMFPVTTKRKTGFLFPTFGWKQGNGLFVDIPFYWAISRDKDATFWFRPYTDGSYKLAAEYRQRFAKDEWLRLYGNYFDESGEESKDKWELNGNAFKRLSWGWEFTGKLDMTSTTSYKKEESETFKKFVEKHNDSYGVLVKRLDNMRFSVLARYQDDLEDNYDEKVLKLPQFDWELYPVRLFSTPFYIESKFQYLKYRNKNDTLRFDHKLSRFDFYPKLSLPISPVPWFSITPKYGVRYTVWTKRLDRNGDEVDNPTSRFLYSFEVDSRGPVLYKDFILGNSTIRHFVIPEVKYKYIPDEHSDQKDIIPFDEVDKILPENKVTYSLTNRFVNQGNAKELLRIKLEQSYDIFKDRKSLPYKFSDIMFEVDALPSSDVNLQYRLYQSVYGFGVTKWSFSGNVRHRFKDFLPSFGVTYYYEKFTDKRFIQYTPALKYKGVELSAYFRRDIYNSYWVERSWNLRINGKCWSIVIGYRTLDNRMNDSRNNRMITFLIVLRGLGQFGLGG